MWCVDLPLGRVFEEDVLLGVEICQADLGSAKSNVQFWHLMLLQSIDKIF